MAVQQYGGDIYIGKDRFVGGLAQDKRHYPPLIDGYKIVIRAVAKKVRILSGSLK